MSVTTLSHRPWIGAALLAATATACHVEAERTPEVQAAAKPVIVRTEPLPVGSFDVQDVRYDDASGSYQLFLLGLPAGRKPLYESSDLQLARLTDEALAAGRKAHLEVGASGATVLHLPEDFKITYVHNVTEERVDPATGVPQTVVVRQETSSWSPFMSAMAGAMVGNMLFSPRYYYPPPYAPGGMTGYGGAGTTRSLASDAYAQRFGTPPKAVTLSRTGDTPRAVSSGSLRSSGQGAGGTRWTKPSGSGKPLAPTRSFGRGFGRGRR